MRLVSAPILALFVASIVTSAPVASAGNDILVAARLTSVVVEPRAAHLKLVNLPVLEFALRAVYRCTGRPVALTLSIADTVRSLSPDELLDRRAVEVSLRVPASQVAMADSGRFCISDDPESADELRVAGFATAAVSLRCDDDGVVSVHYASAPLNVRLSCSRSVDQESVSAADR